MSSEATNSNPTGAATNGSAQNTDNTGTPSEQQGAERTFTQEDINRLIGDARREERKKFSDYDALKAKVAGAKTVEEQLAELQRQNAAMTRDTLAARIAGRHGIAPEDADMFLTGTDEETLTRQAERLSALNATKAKAADKPARRGPYAPLEGRSPKNDSVSEERRTVRALFGGGEE